MRPNGSRLSCGALVKESSFNILRAASLKRLSDGALARRRMPLQNLRSGRCSPSNEPDGTNVVARLQEMGRKRVAQRVAARRLRDPPRPASCRSVRRGNLDRSGTVLEYPVAQLSVIALAPAECRSVSGTTTGVVSARHNRDIDAGWGDAYWNR